MTTNFVSDEMHSPIEDDINASTADAAEFESSQPLILHPTAPENEAHAEAESGNEHHGAQEVSLTGLYISHFLSTWNARTYEFAAVVFTVEAFPNTLLPASIRLVLPPYDTSKSSEICQETCNGDISVVYH
ncbi:hypothetical protein TWF192_005527 [Orbilia oligospora]|uniref:Solute carrier family 40 member n=1 Tax=Orbilia oligospora TaxID=2813651 RepID=A0A6G1MA11_ORBOL|nr:hypothetical protein TWF679_008253 [Orbilia oligospora]KAF3213561.1 hypothetical protein TWF191_010035 [Orbilia oligospora]KAF3249452.1 hypothetical protein TWF192_005527 [Orbilia oligospora]